MNDQLQLLETRYERESLVMSLASLPADSELIGNPPTREFEADLKTNGQRHLIDVTEEPWGAWYVLDGTRRIKGLRHLGETNIEVSWVHGIINPDERHAWSVAVNQLRSDNPVRDASFIAELAGKNRTDKEIAKTLHLTVAEVRRLAKLNELPPMLRKGLEAGKIALGTALTVAKMPRERQARLEVTFGQTGKLSGQDVQAARQVLVSETMQTLALPNMELPEPDPVMYCYCYDGNFTTTTPLGDFEIADYEAGLKHPFEKFRLVRA